MKYLLMLTFLTIPTWAKPKSLMYCLGQEEQKLHKEKNLSHQYKLNQDVISAMVQLHNKVVLKPKHYKVVCDEKTKSPSFELLRVVLINKNDAFINLLEEETLHYGVAQKSIDELNQRMIGVFIDYLAAIRAKAPTHNCITDHIPALKPFYEKLLFLQQDLEPKAILSSITDLHEIFIKLEYVDSIYKKCESAKKQ